LSKDYRFGKIFDCEPVVCPLPFNNGHPLARFDQDVTIMRSAELLDCKSLVPGSLIDVETMSRHYRIECLGGSTIRISGHPHFCPTPVVAQLQGSVTSKGTLEEGMIERGMRLVFLIEEHFPMTTSKVLHLQLEECKGSVN
jgi:hypothetical protein